MSTSRDWRPGFEQQTARVNVGDDTWLKFRRLCLDNDEHVSVALGRLVDREVQRRRPAARPATHEPPRLNASTREQATSKPAEHRPPLATLASTSATAMSSAPTLFDQGPGSYAIRDIVGGWMLTWFERSRGR